MIAKHKRGAMTIKTTDETNPCSHDEYYEVSSRNGDANCHDEDTCEIDESMRCTDECKMCVYNDAEQE